MAITRKYIKESDISAKQQVRGQKRKTEYGTQLAEKQLAKQLYGVMERQFYTYYKEALRREGDTGEILKQMLEMRLDNVIYRSGFAITRAQARQMVSHALFTVNNKKIDIPSYQVKIKDEIAIKAGKETKKVFSDMNERLEKYQAPSWLSVDLQNKKIKIIAVPKGKELEQLFNTRYIVELYSK